MLNAPAPQRSCCRVPPLTQAELISLNKLFQQLGDEPAELADLGQRVLSDAVSTRRASSSASIKRPLRKATKLVRRTFSTSADVLKRKISPRRYPGYKRTRAGAGQSSSGQREERVALFHRDGLTIGPRRALGNDPALALKALHAAHDYYDKKIADLSPGAEFELHVDNEPVLVRVEALHRLEIIRAGCRLVSVRMPDTSLILRGPELGRGALKVAFEAVRAADQELFDIVEVVPFLEDEEGAEQLQAELKIIAGLPSDMSPYFAAAQQGIYAPDESFVGYLDLLYTQMEHRSARNLPERLEIASRYADIAHALSTLHGIGQVYADCKPGNFLERQQRGYLHDFGTLRRTLKERQGLDLSTPTYLSPEAYEEGELTPLSDSWAFGLSLWQQCYGTLTLHQLSDGSTYYEFSYPPFLEELLGDPQKKLAQALPELSQTQIDSELFPKDAQSSEEIALQEVIRCCLRRRPFERMQLEEAHAQLNLLSVVARELQVQRSQQVANALAPVHLLAGAMANAQEDAELAVQALFCRFDCQVEQNGWLRYSHHNLDITRSLLTADKSEEHRALLAASSQVQAKHYPKLEAAAQELIISLGRLLGAEATVHSLNRAWLGARDSYSHEEQKRLELAISQASTVEEMQELEAALARGERPKQLHVIPVSGMLAGAIKTQEVNIATQLELRSKVK